MRRSNDPCVRAGMSSVSEKQMNDAEKQFKTFESMINSMTPQERSNPDLLAKVSSLHARPTLECHAVCVCWSSVLCDMVAAKCFWRTRA